MRKVKNMGFDPVSSLTMVIYWKQPPLSCHVPSSDSLQKSLFKNLFPTKPQICPRISWVLTASLSKLQSESWQFLVFSSLEQDDFKGSWPFLRVYNSPRNIIKLIFSFWDLSYTFIIPFLYLQYLHY